MGELKLQEYFVYLVRGEKQYYSVYMEWDADVVKKYDIKYLGVATLPDKSINAYYSKFDQSNKSAPSTTIKTKRKSIADINRPTEKHCCYCGILLFPSDNNNYPRTKTLEHIIPLSRGGTNNPKNLRNCCNECNQEKGNLILKSYIQLLNLKLGETIVDSLTYYKIQTKIINANEIAKELHNEVY